VCVCVFACKMTSSSARSHKQRKAFSSFVMSVRTSVCPHVSARLPIDWVSWSLIMATFMKICPETLNFVQIGRNYGALYMKT
jgi:hypothetical protein